MMRRTAACLAAALLAALPVAEPVSAQTEAVQDDPPATAVELTLPQLRALAARAVQAGRYDAALQLAGLMLAADAEDSYAHFVVAEAHLRGGDPRLAREAAHLSYRHADTDVQKHEAARAAAAASAREGRFLPAQIWMRRALWSSPGEAMTQRAANEFRALRRKARLRIDGGLTVAPSSNVNGGSSERVNTIEGLPLVGILSPTAQALSGTVARAEMTLRYRLARNERAQTELRAHGEVKRVWLSDEAQDKAPSADNGDFGSSLLEAGLMHRRSLAEKGPVLSLGVHGGRSWAAEAPRYDFGRVSAAMVQSLGARTALTIGHMRQEQYDLDGTADNVTTQAWSLGVMRRLAQGSRLSLNYQVADSQSENVNAVRRTEGLRARFDLGRPVGPVKLGLSLSAFDSHYPDYRVVLPVPGGREDRFYGADLDLTLHRFDVAGFVPKVRLSAERSESNVSRFDTEEYSISVGIESRF
ncbi:hypothetical protein [Salipiger mucosus]|uniref:DUF560 domain-containing protein n=1 Tax=Salipiger mucosus DSM 16094 TaxID=1123237 RepID=S9S0A4_9RHOB|nr:hypothetical protein [Salipiger mucosus]EPX79649.1 hypothetical protein Salmuc_05590 [Salipiger mucosus DSM 16094]